MRLYYTLFKEGKMFKLVTKWIFVAVLNVIFITTVFAASLEEEIKKNIDSRIKNARFGAKIGLQVQSMENGKILYQHNAQDLFVPASNMKILTTTAALLFLKRDFRFHTLLLEDNAGNYYLKFSGDPTLTGQQLHELLSNLKKKNVTTITGNFYIDTSEYDDKSYGPGWTWDELAYCYAAPIEAVILNQNCFATRIIAGKKAGELVQAESESGINIQSRAKTVTKNDCAIDLTAVGNTNDFVMTGCLRERTPPFDLVFALKNPTLYAQHLIATSLQTHNITLSGKILLGNAPANSTIIAQHDSAPLYEIIHTMMKESNDQMANSIFLKIGQVYFKQPATWKNGGTAVTTILTQQAQMNFGKSIMVDGSGISRYNLLTPEFLSKLLNYIYHNQTIFPDFFSALPIAGQDGTLTNRMTEKYMRDRVHAKTGTETGISALSGFVKTQNQGTLTFVIFLNNFNYNDMGNAEAFENEIAEYLARL